MTSDKISAEFRERLDALDDDERVCVLVTLVSPEVTTRSRRRRHDRQRIVAEVEVHTEDALDQLRPMIEGAGGEVLAVTRPLSILTVRADRELVEDLARDDLVAAIIENQEIRGLKA